MAHLMIFHKNKSILKRIEKINNGDINERNKFIQDYIPFIIKNVSKILNMYIESENSDEYMIGLEAFNEALDKYDSSRGSFLSFSILVIRSRLIDYKRKEKSSIEIISFDQYKENEGLREYSELAIDEYNHSTDLQLELMEFKNKLKGFNITLNELTDHCPKHIDTRTEAIKTAKYIYEHEKEKEFLYQKKRLPYIQIQKDLCQSRKFLDRNKKFIIASVLILDSNLDLIKTYLCDVERRSKNDL